MTGDPSSRRNRATKPKTRLLIEGGQFIVSSDRDEELVACALGSCVAVILHDPTRCVGGMIHFRLPISSADPEKARVMPATFADTGIPALFRGMYALGCDKRDLVVKLAGGAAMNGDGEGLNIGARNVLVARRILWQSRLLVAAEAVGKSIPRTVYLDVLSGCCTIRSGSEEYEL